MGPVSFKKGTRVRIGPLKPNGEAHPHAGKTGVVIELMGVFLSGPDWPPRAQVKLDGDQPQGGHIAIVSLVCLEKL
jgi:hypothetical protein